MIVTDEGVWTTANDAGALYRFPLADARREPSGER